MRRSPTRPKQGRTSPDRTGDLEVAEPVRWAILGTANIARANFIPSLRLAGGTVTALGSRETTRGLAFVEQQGLDAAVSSYQEALENPAVEAVYIAVPNRFHLEWVEAALNRKSVVLCEKPLGLSGAEARQAITAAGQGGHLLWEAFAFPFHRQFERLLTLIDEGTIGQVREIVSSFHFPVASEVNIRWQAALGGGALYDVGCYPIHLASLVFADPAVMAQALWSLSQTGVDAEVQGILAYRKGRRLVLSAGMRRPRDTTTRIMGSEGEMLLSDPYHPQGSSSLTVSRGGETEDLRLMTDEPTFTPMLRHINAVIRGREKPRHLAGSDSLSTADALDLVRHAAVDI